MKLSPLLIAISLTSTLGALAFGQAPQLSAPAWLPGDTTPGASTGEQTVPRIAAGGGGYLAVWSDSRALVVGGEQTTDLDVYAMRLDASGTPLDATPIPVTTRYGYQRNPQVAWNGESWLVVWESQDPAFSYYGDYLRGARVSSAGVVLDPQSILIRTSTSSSSIWSMCANGAEWVVAAEGTSAGDNDLVGIRVGANGMLLTPTPVVLQPAEYFLHFGIRVVAAQGQVLLSWSGASNPVARRFGASLAPIGSVFDIPGSNLGTSGNSYYAAWFSGSGVVGSPIALDGTVLNPGGVSLFSGVNALAAPAWDGTRWWIGAQHVTQGILGIRVAANGSPVDPGGLVVQAPAGATLQSPALAGGLGGGAVFAWSSFGPGSLGSNEISTRAASASFALGATTPCSTAAPAQLRPAVCAGPDGYAIAFESALGATRRVLVQRLGVQGNAIDSEPILAGSATTYAGAGIAWNGSVFCVVWNDGSNVVARRMRPDGSFVDPAPIAVMQGASADVDAVGSVFLVVTTNSTSFSPEFRSTFVRRFDGATGSFLDAGPINIGGGFSQLARVATVDGRWLVTYQSNWSHDSAIADVVAAFVNADGSLGTSYGLGTPGGAPQVADGNDGALVVWRYGSTANATNDVVCRRIGHDGSIGVTATLSAAVGRQMNPTVTWDGSQWLVAWEDQRNQVTFYDKRTDIYGSRVAANGAVLDPASFVWLASDQAIASPALATYGARSLLVASDVRPEVPFGAFRLTAVRTLSDCASAARYCSSGTNSSGTAARIDSSGSASLSANNLVLSASNLPANAIGLFFRGTRPIQPATPFGNGLRCVGGATVRLGTLQAAGGVVSAPQNLASAAWNGVSAGALGYVQFWFRDPFAGGAAFDTTDALEFTFCP
ncbi:MAG: hypothetical protein NTY35_06865 [Planctomycetota bacterium]|nr:hypothetical protein [Planctomycetota bacterium]